MTEKRFTGHMNEFLTWFEDNGEKMTHTQILDTLNAQHEEIQKLQERLEIKDFALKKQLEITENQQKWIKELEK